MSSDLRTSQEERRVDTLNLTRALHKAYYQLDLDSAEAVRDLLIDAGIKGSRDSCAHCPIANYLAKTLTAELGEEVRMSVDTEVIYARHGHGFDRIQTDIPVPDAVVDFIGAFDVNTYPEVDDEI